MQNIFKKCCAPLTEILESIVEAKQQTRTLKRPKLLIEVLEHERFAFSSGRTFKGRHALVDKIVSKLRVQREIFVHGDPGTGKSGLAATVRSRIRQVEGFENAYVIIRFLGLTQTASSMARVIASLCCQIAIAFDFPDCEKVEDLETKLLQLDEHILAERFRSKYLPLAAADGPPLVIILDALDQAPTSSLLGRLPRAIDAENIFVLATCTTDFFSLELDSIDEESIVICPGPERSDQELVLDSWLEQDGRKLQPGQQNLFLDASEGSFLVMRVLYEEARKWRSFDSVTLTSRIPVREAIERYLDHTQEIHGRKLVQSALGLLSATVDGLSRSELEDLLSMDSELLASIFQHWVAPIPRVPSLVVTRLLSDLESFLVGHQHHWFHREFHSFCAKRFVSSASFQFLDAYFTGIVECEAFTLPNLDSNNERWQLGRNRGLLGQPWFFEDGRANQRKALELPSARLGRRQKGENLIPENSRLADIDIAHASAAVGLLREYRAILDEDPLEQEASGMLRSVLALSDQVLNEEPVEVGNQFEVRTSDERKRPEYLVNEARRLAYASEPLQHITHNGWRRTNENLESSFQRHDDDIVSLHVDQTGTRVASADSRKAYVWDCRNGDLLFTLTSPRASADINAVYFHETKILLVDKGGSTVFDSNSGSLIQTVGNMDTIDAVLIGEKGLFLEERTLKEFDFSQKKFLLSRETFDASLDGGFVAMTLHPEGSRVFTVAQDCTVNAWSLPNLELLAGWRLDQDNEGSDEEVNSDDCFICVEDDVKVACSKTHLAVASAEIYVRLFNISDLSNITARILEDELFDETDDDEEDTASEISSEEEEGDVEVTGLAFSMDGELLASAQDDGKIVLWKITPDDVVLLQPLPLASRQGCTAMCFIDRTLLVISQERRVSVVQVHEEVQIRSSSEVFEEGITSTQIEEIRGTGGDLVLVKGSRVQILRLGHHENIPSHEWCDDRGLISDVSATADVVETTVDGIVRVWKPRPLEEWNDIVSDPHALEISRHKAKKRPWKKSHETVEMKDWNPLRTLSANCCGFSPSGNQIVVGTRNAEVFLLDAKTGRPVKVSVVEPSKERNDDRGSIYEVEAALFCHCDENLVMCHLSYEGVHLWNILEDSIMEVLDCAVVQAGWVPNEYRIVALKESQSLTGRVQVIIATVTNETFQIVHQSPSFQAPDVEGFAPSPEGWVALFIADEEVLLYFWDSGQTRTLPTDSTNYEYSPYLDLSRDLQRLFYRDSESDDVIKVWNTTSWEEELIVHQQQELVGPNQLPLLTWLRTPFLLGNIRFDFQAKEWVSNSKGIIGVVHGVKFDLLRYNVDS